jgi:ubiquinone/menaquinone biosynthesis C-methylase UbiE
MQKLDYDELAGTYNRRFHYDLNKGTHAALQILIGPNFIPKKILEVGCGTCHWLTSLIAAGHHCFGLDPSQKMLRQSQSHQLCLIQGVAEVLPFPKNTFDVVYCVNAIHHFNNIKSFFLEAFRILSPRGIIGIIGMDPRDQRNKWYLYHFFQGTLERDLKRFPAWSSLQQLLKTIGFDMLGLIDVNFIHDPKTSANVCNDPFLAKSACSQLALLSENAYKKGLEKLCHDSQNPQNREKRYPNDILLSMAVGQKR